MSVAIELAPSAVEVPSSHLHRFTVDEYHRMAAEGILKAEDRVELLEGVLVKKMTHNPPHEYVILKLDDLLSEVLPKGWRRKSQSPITLDSSEPEPDLCIFRGDLQAFRNRHPIPSEIGLVIEVADTSVARDRNVKTRIYGRAGIVAYWLINLPARRVEVFSEPSPAPEGPGYLRSESFSESDKVLLVLDGAVIATFAVADLLP
ncbi:MAG: Uma2 family endonuclease [Gemmataceae bacterium]|nr:Uma2 family endonuclease [Gemmataceae bacterium]